MIQVCIHQLVSLENSCIMYTLGDVVADDVNVTVNQKL